MSACSVPVVSTFCSAAGSLAQGVAGDFIKTAATDAANAANSILQTLVTAWTNLPVQLGGAQAGAATSLIQGDLRGVEVWAGVLGVLVAAARMALFRRGEPFRQAASGLLNMIVIGGAGVVAINLFAAAGDDLSGYLLQNGFGQANAAFDLGLAAGFAPFLLSGSGPSSPAQAPPWWECRSAGTCSATPRSVATRSPGSPAPG